MTNPYFTKQSERIAGPGFIAALDQSGGSTPKALEAYGISSSEWANEEEMFELMHAMRRRILTNSAFDNRISGVILFERTMKGDVEGVPTSEYLWRTKQIVPFLKVDKGLMEQDKGVQMMKPIGGLEETLADAMSRGIYGTKMRSVVYEADKDGVQRIIEQQFDIAQQIIDAGLMPIIEPEISIKSQSKLKTEELLRDTIENYLEQLSDSCRVMLKLTLPEKPNFYSGLISNPRVLRVVALSGGYSLEEANRRLSENTGMTASFSRALVENIRADQSDEEFTQALDTAIQAIYDASIT